MIKILITGSSGQLGRELKDLQAAYPQYRFLFVDRSELDIRDSERVGALFTSFQPQFCINCAAYTAVDKAESEWEQAYAVNVTGVANLAAASTEYSARFVHISTDYVFNGEAATPYTEEEGTAPVNAYGKSKLQGELEAVKNNPDALVIRTSWVYSAYGNNFVKTMIRLIQSRAEINVVADQQGSPTYAADLADAIMHIVQHEDWQPGIYHYTNEGIISWFEFAQAIKKYTRSSCLIHPITTAEYPTPAKRPAYSGLSKEKIKSIYHLKIKPWHESLEKCLEKMNSLQ